MKSRRFYLFALNFVIFLLLVCGTVAAQEPAGVISKASFTPSEKDAAAPQPVPAAPSAAVPRHLENRELLGRVGVQTASPVAITLDDAIRRALANNNNIEIARDDVRIQETVIRSIRGFYDPVFNVSPTYTRNSTTGSAATNDFITNANLTQSLRSGGDYTAFLNNSRTENAFSQAQVSSGSPLAVGTSAIYSSSYGVRLRQPLFRNFATDATRRNLKIARKRLEQTDADFRRTTIDIILAVQQAYWNLVFALRDQQNRQANLDLSRENLRQVEARIAAGASAPLAKAEVETELANREADLLVATQLVSTVENTFKELILKDALAAEWTQSFLPTDKPAFSTDPVSMDAAMKDAMANRHELRRLRTQNEINQIDIDYFKNQIKPQIDLNTTFSMDGFSQGAANNEIVTNQFVTQNDLTLLAGLNQVRTSPTIGLAPIPNPQVVIPPRPSYLFGGFSRSLSNTFRSDAPNWSVGVTISFPFFNRTAKANLAGSEIQRNQIATQLRAQEQAIVVEVRNAVQAVETARQRVLANRRARVNAEIQLEGERKLFDSGRSTAFLLFQRENAVTAARNAEIRAETDYNKAVADLQRATSTTFELNNIVVTSPTN
jgi:outer membrane protein